MPNSRSKTPSIKVSPELLQRLATYAEHDQSVMTLVNNVVREYLDAAPKTRISHE